MCIGLGGGGLAGLKGLGFEESSQDVVNGTNAVEGIHKRGTQSKRRRQTEREC